MGPEQYIIETLEIELNRLKFEDRSTVHYSARNENNQVCSDRWARMEALRKAIRFHERLVFEQKTWAKSNEFNGVAEFWEGNG